MKKNDVVFVRPSCSMKFGGRWGIISDITDDGLPVKVIFSESTTPYGFLATDLMSMKSYFNWFEVDTKVYNIVKEQYGVITSLEFPKVWVDGSRSFITNILPVDECADCGTEMVGTFQYICDECHYGGDING